MSNTEELISWANENLPLPDEFEWSIREYGKLGSKSVSIKTIFWHYVWVYEPDSLHLKNESPIITSEEPNGGTERYWGTPPDDPYETMKVMYGIFCMMDK